VITSRKYKSAKDGYIQEIQESEIGQVGYLGRKKLPSWENLQVFHGVVPKD